MTPSQIPDKIASLCGENSEIIIFESGKEFYITSENIKKNFHLFIIYNPFNKCSKHLNQVLLINVYLLLYLQLIFPYQILSQ